MSLLIIGHTYVKMVSIKFVFVVFAVLNGQCILGYQNGAETEILSAEARAVLKAAVDEISTKYDTVIHEIQAVVAGQQKHIEDLQNDKAILQEAVSALKTEVIQHELRLKELTHAVTEQSKHVQVLEVGNKRTSDSIEWLGKKLNERMVQCECNRKPLKNESSKMNVTSVKPEVDTVDTNDAVSGHHSHIRRANAENEVAFLAYISQNGLQDHLGQNQDIVFDHVVTNIGNGYVPHHGTFIAPVAGTYVFSASLHVPSNSRANFVADGNVVARFYADSDEPTHISQTIVVTLNKGADVSVQNMVTDKSYYGDRYTTFSGFLLYQTFDNTQVVG